MSYRKSSIGSVEEIETYGVWVKSEPQDITAGLAGIGDFDGGGFSFETDYDDFESPDMSISEIGFTAADDKTDDFFGGFDDDITAGTDGESGPDEGRDFREEVSSGILMKITNELASIRSELTILKREFEEIRGEGGDTAGREEDRIGGFFSDDEDEKITLSDDEMTDIFSSAEFSAEDISYDPLREEDEEALRTLSEKNEAADMGASFSEEFRESGNEEIEIDFDNLGIVLDSQEENPAAGNDEARERADQESAALEAADLGSVALGSVDLESVEQSADLESAEPGSEDLEAADRSVDDPFEGIDDLPPFEELAASSETSGLKENSFTEEDTFASLNSGLDDMSRAGPDENPPEIMFDEEIEINLDELSMDIADGSDGEFSEKESPDNVSLDLSEAVIDEPEPAGTAEILQDGLILDDFSLSDDFSMEEQNIVIESDSGGIDDGIARVIPEAFETDAAESSIPFDDDLDGLVEEDLSAEIEEPLIDLAVREPAVREPAAKEPKEPVVKRPAAKEPVAGEPALKESLVETPVKQETESPDSVSGEYLEIPSGVKKELRDVLSYMDHLLESLPEEKIEEFARSEYFDAYKKLFKELDLA